MQRSAFLVLCAVLLVLPCVPGSHAHTYKVSVIVDTDMALDDIRALSMLLNSHMTDIPLIVTSDGVVSPEIGCQNLDHLLRYFGHREIPIGRGTSLGKDGPPWRAWCEEINWPEIKGASTGPLNCRPAAEAILETLRAAAEPVVYLCLGPLTNLAEALDRDSGIREKISRLVYFGAHPDDAFPGWNTAWDPASARAVFGSGLEIYATVLPEKDLLPFDEELYQRIRALDTDPARLIAAVHDTHMLRMILAEKRFYVWDEMTVIFLNEPALFRFVPSARSPEVMALADYEGSAIPDAYVKLLGPAADFHLDPRQAVVLEEFPTDPALFRKDVAPFVEDILARHGLEEWKACLLTNELHRHLGIYSLIGAKMGIRAREVLGAPFDTLKVVSFAGGDQPLSCMNDGLQVATGASLGRGAIKVPSGAPRAAASFYYGDEKLTLSIKPAVMERVKADIRAALERFGGLNADYFAHIRALSIRYWLDLDRREIFDAAAE